MRKISDHILLAVASVVLTGCFFTGVEGTKSIDDKQTTKKAATTIVEPLDSLAAAPFTQWRKGDAFIVTDEQIGILVAEISPKAEIRPGDTLRYVSAVEENIYGTKSSAYVNFTLHDTVRVKLKSGKTMAALREARSLPFLVADAAVERAKAEMAGRELYIATPQWYDPEGNATTGIKYARVKITDVVSGNKVYSIKVMFEYDGKPFSLYMSLANDAVTNRRFSNLFARTDPHQSYPQITDEHWAMIQRGLINDDMTRDECRLALGAPASINKSPSYQGLREVWQYSDGRYLIFIDGILTDYRK